MSRRRCLVTGWFSFPEVVATAGDLLARDVACSWLQQAGRAYDVASVAPFADRGVDWRAAEPGRYDELLFVCGPFGAKGLIGGLLDRFAHCHIAQLPARRQKVGSQMLLWSAHEQPAIEPTNTHERGPPYDRHSL